MSEYTDILLPKTKKQSTLSMHDFIKQSMETGEKESKHISTKTGNTYNNVTSHRRDCVALVSTLVGVFSCV